MSINAKYLTIWYNQPQIWMQKKKERTQNLQYNPSVRLRGEGFILKFNILNIVPSCASHELWMCVDTFEIHYQQTTPVLCKVGRILSNRGCIRKTILFASSRLYCVTTLQSIMNAKLSKQSFWHCYENELIKTIQMIPHKLYESVKLTSLYCWLSVSWLILIPSKGKLTWDSPIGCGVSFESRWWAHFHGSAKTYAD